MLLVPGSATIVYILNGGCTIKILRSHLIGATTLNITTLSIMTLSITTLSIMTLSIMPFSITLNTLQHSA
jgi:hypothetical protein